MTQYLLSVWGTHTDSETGPYADQDEMAAASERVAAYNQRLTDEGVLVYAAGLESPETAVVVDGTKSEASQTSGTAISGQTLGGFWVVETSNPERALALGAEASAACGVPVEVRPMQQEA